MVVVGLPKKKSSVSRFDLKLQRVVGTCVEITRVNVRMEYGISISSHTKDCVRSSLRVIARGKMPMIDSRCPETTMVCVLFLSRHWIDCHRIDQLNTEFNAVVNVALL